MRMMRNGVQGRGAVFAEDRDEDDVGFLSRPNGGGDDDGWVPSWFANSLSSTVHHIPTLPFRLICSFLMSAENGTRDGPGFHSDWS